MNQNEPICVADKNAAIIDDLCAKGWSIQNDYLSRPAAETLKNRLTGLDAASALSTAGIGRKDEHQIAPDIRKDRTYWLERENSEDLMYLSLMNDLKTGLNRNLFLGLFEYEAHYAVYPPGGFYKKHFDALKGGKNRIISTVCYLNDENWQDEDVGHLKLYDRTNPDDLVCTALPRARSLAVFLSEDIPHEVATAHRERRSIAGWFRCNASSADRADPLR